MFKRQKGLIPPLVLFLIASIGIASTATLGLYKAYEEYIIKSKEKADLTQLKGEVAQFQKETERLKVQNNQLKQELEELRADKTEKEQLLSRLASEKEILEKKVDTTISVPWNTTDRQFKYFDLLKKEQLHQQEQDKLINRIKRNQGRVDLQQKKIVDPRYRIK